MILQETGKTARDSTKYEVLIEFNSKRHTVQLEGYRAVEALKDFMSYKSPNSRVVSCKNIPLDTKIPKNSVPYKIVNYICK